MEPCIASQRPPPEYRGGGASATSSSTAANCALTFVGDASRKSSAGTTSRPSGSRRRPTAQSASKRPARSGTSGRSTSRSGRARLATWHDLDLRVQRGCERSDGPELRVDVCREEPSHNRIVAADVAGQLRLGETGVDAQGVKLAHDLVDLGELLPGALILGPKLGVLHPLGDAPLVMTGVQHSILRVASTRRSVAPMLRVVKLRQRSRWTGYAGPVAWLLPAARASGPSRPNEPNGHDRDPRPG